MVLCTIPRSYATCFPLVPLFMLHTGFWMQHYLYSLDACADNLSVVVFGAKGTRVLAPPQEVERTTVTRPLWTVTVEQNTDMGDYINLGGENNFQFQNVTAWNVSNYTYKYTFWEGKSWKKPWQRDLVFLSPRGVTSQSDGARPALFTSLSRLTGPRNIKFIIASMWYISVFDSQLHFLLQQSTTGKYNFNFLYKYD